MRRESGLGSSARRRDPRGWRIFALGILAGVLLIAAWRTLINETSMADWLVSPLLLSDTAGPADVIVVMGAGVLGECGLNINSVRRVLLGARLWRSNRAPHLLFTGGRGFGVPTCPVAEAMARLALEVGVPADAIFTEVASRTSRENGELSVPLLHRLGARRVLMVTDRLHMVRSAGVFEELGFTVERAAVPVYEGHIDNVDMLAAAAREAAAIGYYRMRGWLGVSRTPAGTGQDLTQAGEVSEAMSRERATSPSSYPDGPIVVLGASYASGWTMESVAGVPVVNRGVAGQQSFEMRERFERDVVSHRPRAVILWGFINDIFRAGGDVPAAAARARDNFKEMVALARQHGIEPIVATEVTIRPPASLMNVLASWVGAVRGKPSYQAGINREVVATNAWLVELARREGLLLLDLQSMISEQGGMRRREYAQQDGSHISAAGYAALTEYAQPLLARYIAGAVR